MERKERIVYEGHNILVYLQPPGCGNEKKAMLKMVVAVGGEVRVRVAG